MTFASRFMLKSTRLICLADPLPFDPHYASDARQRSRGLRGLCNPKTMSRSAIWVLPRMIFDNAQLGFGPGSLDHPGQPGRAKWRAIERR
jgi:hypothetical protein